MYQIVVETSDGRAYVVGSAEVQKTAERWAERMQAELEAFGTMGHCGVLDTEEGRDE